MLRTGQATVMVQVIRYIGVIRPHDGYFFRSRILYDVQGCTIGRTQVYDTRFVIIDVLSHGGTDREPDAVRQFWFVRIRNEGDGYRIVHEYDVTMRVCPIQVRVGRIARIRGEYTDVMARR